MPGVARSCWCLVSNDGGLAARLLRLIEVLERVGWVGKDAVGLGLYKDLEGEMAR